jgi:uncharacterized tellurite resistance protein B-like protein
MNPTHKALFSLVYQLQCADHKLESAEINFLRDVGLNLGLTTQDIDNIMLHPEKYPLIPPPPEEERMKILYYLLFAMKIDGDIHPNEEKIIYRTGLKLGFVQSMLAEMITEMKNHLTTRLPDDALLKIVRKYLN